MSPEGGGPDEAGHARPARPGGWPYRRLFPDLPAWTPPGNDDAEREAALVRLAARVLERDQAAEADNSSIPAGYTYFGQFLVHDVSHLQGDGESAINRRSPAFDLDSVYGRGPELSPEFYDETDPWRFRAAGAETRPGSVPLAGDLDLWREHGVAVIPDNRNDEHVVIAQLHLAFQRFHNALLDCVRRTSSLEDAQAFALAQDVLRLHFQWVIVHDYLPTLVGQDLMQGLLGPSLRGRPNLAHVPMGGGAFVPHEFASGVFRVGHSMARPGYRLSFNTPVIPLFAPEDPDREQPVDLRGGRSLVSRWGVNWSLFLDRSELDAQGRCRRGRVSGCQVSKRLDLRATDALAHLPLLGGGGSSLVLLDLQTSCAQRLPSGQAVAREMGLEPYSNSQLGIELPDEVESPLLFYALGEAALDHDGRRLGRMGGLLVAESVLGLLHADRRSILHQPDWVPTFLAGGAFELSDLVRMPGRLARGTHASAFPLDEPAPGPMPEEETDTAA
jgi:hypothetical protein